MTNDRRGEDIIERIPWPAAGDQARVRPPSADLDALRPLLQDPDPWIAYRAAARLCAWGDDRGALWLAQFLAGSPGEPIAPHRLWGHEDYDSIASYAFDYGLSGGNIDIETGLYRRLLAKVATHDMTTHLPVALYLSRATPAVADELHDTAATSLDQPACGGLALLEALATVDPARATQLIERAIERLPNYSDDLGIENDIAGGIAELRSPAAWSWANQLSRSSLDHLHCVGQAAVEKIADRVQNDCCWWWRSRWQQPGVVTARQIGLVESDSQLLQLIRNSLWGAGEQLARMRRLLRLRQPEPQRRWDTEELQELLARAKEITEQGVDALLIEALGTILGDSDSRVSLDAALDRRLEQDSSQLPAPELGHDQVGEVIAEAAYSWSCQTGDWATFERTARRMLDATAKLGVSVVFAAALLDAKRPALVGPLEAAYELLLVHGEVSQASLLLPAMAEFAGERAWVHVERTLAGAPGGLPLDPRIFATVALGRLGDRGRRVSASLTSDSNSWVTIFAEAQAHQLA